MSKSNRIKDRKEAFRQSDQLKQNNLQAIKPESLMPEEPVMLINNKVLSTIPNVNKEDRFVYIYEDLEAYGWNMQILKVALEAMKYSQDKKWRDEYAGYITEIGYEHIKFVLTDFENYPPPYEDEAGYKKLRAKYSAKMLESPILFMQAREQKESDVQDLINTGHKILNIKGGPPFRDAVLAGSDSLERLYIQLGAAMSRDHKEFGEGQSNDGAIDRIAESFKIKCILINGALSDRVRLSHIEIQQTIAYEASEAGEAGEAKETRLN